MSENHKLYWGETHDNTHQAEDPDFSMDRRLETARRHLDFYCGAYYPSTSPAFKKGGHPSDDKRRQPLNVERWKSAEQIQREWTQVKQSIQKYNRGGFVTFPGYEWQGDGTWGDHNVFFCEDDPPLYRVNSLGELYSKLKTHRALAIPHHTAYTGGFRGKNWDVLEPDISPFAEIFSIHGSSEGDRFGEGLRSNPFLGPDISAGSYSRALKKRYRIGAVASTDNWGAVPGHYGRGLAAVWAESLNREALWDAFCARRVYAVTGDRINLRFSSGGDPMGSLIFSAASVRHFDVQAEGQDSIDFIDFLKDEELTDRFSPLAAEHPSAGEFVFRVEFGWGPSAAVSELPPKIWEGRIRISGGRIKSVTPCMVSPDNSYTHSEHELNWNGMTDQSTVSERYQNAYILKVQGDADTLAEFEIDGQKIRRTLAEMTSDSLILWNREESVRLIRDNFSVNAEQLERKDVIFGMAYKSRISLAAGEKSYKITHRFTDSAADGKPHVYRVRIVQKNGQKAWSSPIWYG